MISALALSKSYGKTVAVDSLSFEVRPREVMGFLGPNGAGKTTTLRMLAGYLAPSSGSARLADCDIREDNLELRRRIGYLPENNPLYEDAEVAEHLEWVARLRGLRAERARARVRFAVEACALGEVLGKPIGLLSKGYRQRVGLAAAILHDPEILLLDEPTSGLDPNQTRELRELIARLKTEKTVLLSTHILSEVEASCDRILILHRGKVAACGMRSELCGAQESSLSLGLAHGPEPEAVRAGLLSLGASSCEASLQEGELRARLKAPAGTDLREDVFRLCVERGWTLRELRRESASLERLFQELTAS